MDFDLLNIMSCATVPTSWVLVGLHRRRCERRRRQREGSWEHFARNRIQLDRDLDRIWT